MVKKTVHITFILLLVSLPLFAQSNKVASQNLKLKKIKSEIEKLQKKLDTKKKLEKQSLNYLEGIEKKILLLNKYVNELKREERKTAKEIKRIDAQIGEIENHIAKLRNMYSAYLVWYYKYGRTSRLNLLLSSGSINDAVVKLKYFKIIADRVKKLYEDLSASDERLTAMRQNKSLELKKQRRLIAEKQREQRKFILAKKQKKRLLAKLRKDQSALLASLHKKRIAEKEIEKQIAELIRLENERIAKRKEGRGKSSAAAYDYSNFENFSGLRGRLVWPVSGGKISRPFGKNYNKKLKTVTLNYGIDIKTKKSVPVKAVAGGVVSKIDWIPGYGTVLILTHKNNFRTVYGHLTDIRVDEGDRVNAGMVLGYVDDSLEGYVLHFEIWKARKNQNPQKWLARR
jgi:septal ring factor EnvC (AmiA/AmiB activator)